jgi:large subunit ribosomal protein L35
LVPEGEETVMPKIKTHKGVKKRFKVSATGKVSHKRCGSSHLMSHKSGKQVRRLRKKSFLQVKAEARRLRRALHDHEGKVPIREGEVEEADAPEETPGASSDHKPKA